MDIAKIAGTEIKMTAELKDRIKKDGLTFVESMKLENGAVYRGYVKGQQRHGPGTQLWPDGARYTGEWRFNKASGKG